MSIMELGALGEFIGAIAVVATLGYLAMQIRQSARSTKSNAIAQAASDHIANLRSIAEQPELATAFEKATRGDELDPRESVQISFWLLCFLRGVETQVMMAQLDVVPEFEAPWKDLLRGMLQPGGPWGRFHLRVRPMIEGYIGTPAFNSWLKQYILT